MNEIAELSGVSKRTLEEIFSGRARYPRIETVQAIEKALNINEIDNKQNDSLSSEEENIIKIYRKLSPQSKKMIFKYFIILLDT